MSALEARLRLFDAFEDADLDETVTAADAAARAGLPPGPSAALALGALGFKRVAGGRWRRPVHWPEIVAVQRSLSRMMVPVGEIERCTLAAAGVAGILEQAIGETLTAHDTLHGRGRLSAQVRKVIQDLHKDSIPRRELAAVLKESPDAPKSALLYRVEGLMRLAQRRERQGLA